MVSFCDSIVRLIKTSRKYEHTVLYVMQFSQTRLKSTWIIGLMLAGIAKNMGRIYIIVIKRAILIVGNFLAHSPKVHRGPSSNVTIYIIKFSDPLNNWGVERCNLIRDGCCKKFVPVLPVFTYEHISFYDSGVCRTRKQAYEAPPTPLLYVGSNEGVILFSTTFRRSSGSPDISTMSVWKYYIKFLQTRISNCITILMKPFS